MLRIIILVPILLLTAWFIYLKLNKFSLAQGKQGFVYILIVSSVIALFYSVMLMLTH